MGLCEGLFGGVQGLVSGLAVVGRGLLGGQSVQVWRGIAWPTVQLRAVGSYLSGKLAGMLLLLL